MWHTGISFVYSRVLIFFLLRETITMNTNINYTKYSGGVVHGLYIRGMKKNGGKKEKKGTQLIIIGVRILLRFVKKESIGTTTMY